MILVAHIDIKLIRVDHDVRNEVFDNYLKKCMVTLFLKVFTITIEKNFVIKPPSTSSESD